MIIDDTSSANFHDGHECYADALAMSPDEEAAVREYETLIAGLREPFNDDADFNFDEEFIARYNLDLRICGNLLLRLRRQREQAEDPGGWSIDFTMFLTDQEYFLARASAHLNARAMQLLTGARGVVFYRIPD